MQPRASTKRLGIRIRHWISVSLNSTGGRQTAGAQHSPAGLHHALAQLDDVRAQPEGAKTTRGKECRIREAVGGGGKYRKEIMLACAACGVGE
jgi:hypothetical protein